ncbi:MAG: type II secretion system F family protein [Myxococcales bacterium]|nr:type II secretion system F family protein [Myxococcota bacterium]MDW8282500.1 type II secretion system F family protein [Myxococcales bacterium]
MLSILFEIWKYTASLVAAAASFLLVEAVLSPQCPDFEIRGRRAGNRRRALRDSPLFVLIQPLLRFFTAYAAMIKAPRLRAQLELWLRQADELGGLVPSEVMALCLMCACFLGGFVYWQIHPLAAPGAFLLGLLFPYDTVRGAARKRIQTIGRSIPTMADLIVLSMEAGMDFIGSVRLLVSRSTIADGKMPVRDELLMFLHQLQLGRTRRQALELLRKRVPTDAVRSFTISIIQAEEKGMPLRDVLRIQAEVLRHKRVQEAEAYIQTANLQLLGPILVVIISLMSIIIVPMVIIVGENLRGGGKVF